MKENKVTFAEIPGIAIRGIGLLFTAFLGYNFAIALGLALGGAMMLLLESAFSAVDVSIVSIIQSWVTWCCQHPTASIVALAIVYVVGFCGFIHTFVMKMAQNMKVQGSVFAS